VKHVAYHRQIEEHRVEIQTLRNRLTRQMREEKLRIKALSSTFQPQDPERAGSMHLAALSGLPSSRAQTERGTQRAPTDSTKFRQARFQKELHRQVMKAASASIFERKRQARDQVKSVLLEEHSRAKQIKFNDKLRQMKGVMKAKLSEIATVKAEKSRILSKKIEVSKRLEKENKQNLKKLKEAQRLVNYSLDIENMIKSNIEIAADLKAHYSSRAGPQASAAEASDKVVEGFSQVVCVDEPSQRENSSNSLEAKKSASSTRAGPELSYDVNRLRRSQLLQPGLEDGEVCTPRHGDSELQTEPLCEVGSIDELRTTDAGNVASTDRPTQGFLPRISKNPRSLIRKAC
jgi:hypothetical protein